MLDRVSTTSLNSLPEGILLISLISNMLEFIFYLQPPVATVYITNSSKDTIMEQLSNIENIEEFNVSDINILHKVLPNKPFLPFL